MVACVADRLLMLVMTVCVVGFQIVAALVASQVLVR